MKTHGFKSAAICFTTVIATVIGFCGVGSAQPTFELLHEFSAGLDGANSTGRPVVAEEMVVAETGVARSSK